MCEELTEKKDYGNRENSKNFHFFYICNGFLFIVFFACKYRRQNHNITQIQLYTDNLGAIFSAHKKSVSHLYIFNLLLEHFINSYNGKINYKCSTNFTINLNLKHQ